MGTVLTKGKKKRPLVIRVSEEKNCSARGPILFNLFPLKKKKNCFVRARARRGERLGTRRKGENGNSLTRKKKCKRP